MSVAIPPPSNNLVRTLSTYHWEKGLSIFVGKPVKVAYLHASNNYWLHTIESFQSKIMCITRLNGEIFDMFDAKEIR